MSRSHEAPNGVLGPQNDPHTVGPHRGPLPCTLLDASFFQGWGPVSFRTTSGSALELAGDLQTASTNESETYRNGPLCSAPLFDIQHLEVYAFTG